MTSVHDLTYHLLPPRRSTDVRPHMEILHTVAISESRILDKAPSRFPIRLGCRTGCQDMSINRKKDKKSSPHT